MQDQNQDYGPRPWRLRGPNGQTVVHPNAVVCAVEAQRVLRQTPDGPEDLGPGARLVFLLDGCMFDVLVLSTPDHVEQMIAERGGWDGGGGESAW